MRRAALPLLSIVLLTLILGFGWQIHPILRPMDRSVLNVAAPVVNPPKAVCFAEGTPPEYVHEWQRRLGGESSLDYFVEARWSRTATNTSTGSAGSPITLTYSFVPDGLDIDGQESQLFARLDQLFGSTAAWQAKFAQVFQRWSEVSGLHYQQVTDDGASFGTDGQLGARGDVRIGSVPIDGENGVLAYDYFPDVGDMVLDASENWGSSAGNYIFLRNIVAHEHGHGWGLAHVCPTNQTKLLEPYYTGVFDGPQHDDIRAAQLNYGDRFEPNDLPTSATYLGLLTADVVINDVSVDHPSYSGQVNSRDIDYYKFAVPAGMAFSLNLEPVGRSYLNGQQDWTTGACEAGTMINSLNTLNLSLTLYNRSGTVEVARDSSHGAGQAETLFRYTPSLAGDSFYVKVTGVGLNSTMQLYRLSFDLYYAFDPTLSVAPVSFDTTAQGTPAIRTTWLVNHATYALQVSAMEVEAPFFVSPAAPQSIAPSDSLQLTLTYAAAQAGSHSGVLRITHNAPGAVMECPLSGLTADSWLEFIPSAQMELGDVPLGGVDSARIGVRARGNIPVVIQNFVIAPPFTVSQSLPHTLNPTQVMFLWIHFTPTVRGDNYGQLVVEHSSGSSPDTLFLHGTSSEAVAPQGAGALPTAFRLEQNYPNPFNPTTRIGFDVPRASEVRLTVYDIQGRLVRALAPGMLAAGHHTLEFDGAALPTGIYLYRLTAPGFSASAKMMLLK